MTGNEMVVMGPAFGMAVQKHFSLPPLTLSDLIINTGRDQLFSLTVTITLDGDDLIEIGRLMNASKSGTRE